MGRYTKDDVQLHEASFHGPQLPAVNVKIYHFPSTYDVMDRFDCSEEVAGTALEYAFQSVQQAFWEDWANDTSSYFPNHNVKVFSAGRSGGWLVVEGLPEIEDWDAVMFGRWRKFEKAVNADVNHRTGREAVLEDIEANRWAESGARLYNFIDTPDGPKCLVDIS